MASPRVTPNQGGRGLDGRSLWREQSRLIGEDAALNPYSPYGFHKMIMESICESYGASYGVRAIVARLFSVYGSGLKKQLLWDLCTKLLKDPNRTELGGTGRELRDWVAANDAARILSRMGPLATAEVPKVNVGTGVGTTVREVAQHLIDVWRERHDAETLSFSGQARPGDPFSLVASPQRLLQLGFTCNVPVHDGIARYVAWFKSLASMHG
jgi:UDP-glucose 4-epimerase